jgi:TPR repeat protein
MIEGRAVRLQQRSAFDPSRTFGPFAWYRTQREFVSLAIMLNALELSESDVYDRDARRDALLGEYVEARALAFTDPHAAIASMEALAFRGSIMAILYVADAIQTGWIYGTKYPERAEAWYKVAAEGGSSRALHELGRTQRARGDFDAALSSIASAISQNYPPAINSMAIMKYHGEVVPRDREEAKALWTRGARLGHPPSSRNLGMAYLDGAFGWWRVPLGVLELVRSAALYAASERYSDRRR